MDLAFLPLEELRRLRALPLPPAVRAGLFADACRLNTLYAIMRAGSGHIGSSFSAMDAVAWLHLEVLRGDDLYFSSKGHDAPGLYAVLTGLERLEFDGLHRLRQLGGLPGHPDVGTPGIPCNTGSLGMGVSKAKGFAMAARLAGRRRRAFVLTGDGELQEGQFWESLPGAANRGLGEITVLVDHNKIQSDTWVEAVSPLGDLEAKFAAFGWDVRRCDGHDFPAMAAALEGAGKGERPRAIILDTVKGKGVSFMERTSAAGEFEFYRFHSGAPSEENFAAAAGELREKIDAGLRAAGQPPAGMESVQIPSRPAPVGQRLVAAYGRALLAAADRLPCLVAFDADLMLDCGLGPFVEKYPERFIECGIAEQDMVSQAGALARSGWLPVVHSFACFLSTRPNEQIYNNATEHSKVLYVMSLAGLVPGGPGHSHQSVRDIAALAAVPGLVLLEPATEAETAEALDYFLSTENAESGVLRLVSIPVEIPFELPPGEPLRPGCGRTLVEGEDAVVFAYGPVMLAQAWHAVEGLRARDGVRVRLIDLPWLNRLDASWLAEQVRGTRAVVTIDNHYLTGGQGEMIGRALAESVPGAPPLLRLGVRTQRRGAASPRARRRVPARAHRRVRENPTAAGSLSRSGLISRQGRSL